MYRAITLSLIAAVHASKIGASSSTASLDGMSKSSHKNAALDSTRPLSHRASHARSFGNHVAANLGISREQLFQRVETDTGVELEAPGTEEKLLIAMHYMQAQCRAAV
ncbi:MAG TPA: hypothetical protein PLB00_13760 [Pseudomonadota bacterium]|nr:hypothetical protein [Pseudomonadota bacterium]